MTRPTGDQIAVLNGVSGAISLSECILLFEVASELTEGIIVEVGAFHGKSTVSLAMGSKMGAGIEVYSIDPHETLQDSTAPQMTYTPQDRTHFIWSILRSDVSDLVRPVFMRSSADLAQAMCWNDKISLLFVDGDHAHPNPTNDLRYFLPYVADDGVIVLDDTDQEGPAKAVAWLEDNGWRRDKGIDKMTSLRRKG